MSEITIHRCARGHEFFYRHKQCPTCDEPLETVAVEGIATLEGCTTVRVNPSGRPFRLGIAGLASGAATLCLIDGDADVGDTVTLRFEDGVFRGAIRNRR